MDAYARKLEQVRKLWEIILQRETILDIYTNKPIESEYDIDHFIPWSFVMNDELWNLIPMDSSLNSSKSNRLCIGRSSTNLPTTNTKCIV